MADERRMGNRQKKEQQQRFLSDKDPAFGTTLVALLIDHFKSVDWFEWEPEVLDREIKDDFGVEMPIGVRDRVNALTTSLSTDLFYNDPIFFNHVCNALGGDPTPMGVYEPAELEEIAWGVTEVLLSDHKGDNFEEFGDEVKIYVGQVLKDAGLKPFAPLDWALDMGQGQAFDFTDDPGMMSATFQEREEDKFAVSSFVQMNLKLLHHQLDQLQIEADARNASNRERREKTRQR